jgi:uncharacterized membrane protein YdjX (TVP38/TMEM64 family)
MRKLTQKTKKELHRLRYDIIIGLIIFGLAFFAYLERDRFGAFSERESFESFIDGFGVWGPAVIIASIVLEVVIAPIPGFIPALTAGFVFGPIAGSVYVYLGNVLGTLLVFYVARRLGKLVVEKFIKKRRLEKYEKTIEKHENWLLVFYFIPVLPIDIITAAFGLSGIRFKKFLFVILLGLAFYSIVITNFGDYLAQLWF